MTGVHLRIGGAIHTIDSMPFARGGEGALHAVRTADDDRAVKLYTGLDSDARRRDRATFLIAHPPANTGSLALQGWELIWPQAAVSGLDGSFRGVTMRRVRAAVPLSELTAHAAVVDRRLGSQWGAYRLPSRLGLALRLQLAMRIARSLAAVHDDGRYVLGDLKPDNLLVTCDGRVALVDCDSVQVVTSGETLFGSLVRTDDYVPPEGFDPAFIARWKEGEALESSWDAFSLAVILYQLLLGIHPFAVQGRDAVRGVIVDTVRDAIRTGCYAQGARRSQTIRIPAPHHQFARLPSTIRAALQRSLEDGHHDPTARLSPAEWLEVLTPHVLPQWRLTGYRRSVHIVAGIRASAIKVRGSAYRLTLSLDVFLTRLGQLWSDRRFELPDVRWRDTVGFWLGTFAWSAVDLLLLNPEPGTPQYLPPASIVPLRTAQVSVGDSLTAAPLLGPIVDPLVVGPDSTNSVVMAPPMVLTFARAGILVQRDSVVAHGPSAVVVVRQLLTAQPSGEYVVMVRYERTVEGLLRTTPTDTLLLLPSQARLGDHWWSLHGTPRRISAVRLGTMGTMGAYAPGVELRVREPATDGERVRTIWLSACCGVIREWIGDGVDDASAGAAIELVGVRGRQALAIKGEGSSTR